MIFWVSEIEILILILSLSLGWDLSNFELGVMVISGLKVRLIWVFVFSEKKKIKDRGMDYDILLFIFS